MNIIIRDTIGYKPDANYMYVNSIISYLSACMHVHVS